MSVFSNIAFDDHERVLFCRDQATGLNAIIAIHWAEVRWRQSRHHEKLGFQAQ